jgi:hypothetical protein
VKFVCNRPFLLLIQRYTTLLHIQEKKSSVGIVQSFGTERSLMMLGRDVGITQLLAIVNLGSSWTMLLCAMRRRALKLRWP